MSSTSSPRTRRTSVLALSTLWACHLLTGDAARAQPTDKTPPESVTLSVRISVTIRGGGRPVGGAEILISRHGVNRAGLKLADIKLLTDDGGQAGSERTDFRLAGQPHKVVVTAQGFKKLELDLPDVVLREAAHYDNQLTLALSLASLGAEPQSHPVATPVATNATPPYVTESVLGRIARTLLGALSVLGAVAVVALAAGGVWLYESRTRWRFHRLSRVMQNSPRASSPRTADAPTPKVDGATVIRPATAPEIGITPLLKDIRNHLSMLDHRIEMTQRQMEKMSSALMSPPKLASEPTRSAPAPIPQPQKSPAGEYRQRPRVMGGSSQDGVNTGTSAGRAGELIRKPPFEQRVRESYLRLVNREPPGMTPLYLESEAKSTPADKMADNNVYLAQFETKHTTFVAFTEDDRQGWVFPNPAVQFVKAAVKEVFPNLTETSFDSDKQQITPVRVVRDTEARWKVG